jgi:hypothetical protein
MTHFSKTTPLLALAVLAFATQQTRADFVPWSYNWEPSPLIINAHGSTHGHLALTDEPLKHAVGASDVIVTNIRAFSTAPRRKPDHFAHAMVSFTLVLTDLLSGQSAVLRFRAFFTGTISATSADVRLHYLPPRMEKVELGGHMYTVALGRYSPPGTPGASNAGSVTAHVTVDAIVPPPPEAPSPSSLVLSCIGLAGLGVVGWQRWHSKGARQ